MYGFTIDRNAIYLIHVYAEPAEYERLPSFELLEQEESDSYSSKAEEVLTIVLRGNLFSCWLV